MRNSSSFFADHMVPQAQKPSGICSFLSPVKPGITQHGTSTVQRLKESCYILDHEAGRVLSMDRNLIDLLHLAVRLVIVGPMQLASRKLVGLPESGNAAREVHRIQTAAMPAFGSSPERHFLSIFPSTIFCQPDTSRSLRPGFAL